MQQITLSNSSSFTRDTNGLSRFLNGNQHCLVYDVNMIMYMSIHALMMWQLRTAATDQHCCSHGLPWGLNFLYCRELR